MPKILDNKQIIHIASEIVVLIGITFYFSQKNRTLMKHIEHLAERLEEQEDVIKRHEQTIGQLIHAIQELRSFLPRYSTPEERSSEVTLRSPELRDLTPVSPKGDPPPKEKEVKVTFSDPIEISEPSRTSKRNDEVVFDASGSSLEEHAREEDELSNEELDKELKEEYRELEDLSETSLKNEE